MTMPVVDCDLLVIGSGAGAMSAALSAVARGARVLVVEKASVFGGTTAVSGGVMWVPANHVARREGVEDDADLARAYLRALLGDRYDPPFIDAYLATAPDMLRFLEEELRLPLTTEIGTPDYRSDLPGALARGRSVQVAGLSGTALGRDLRHLRPPLEEMTLFGLQIGSGINLDDLYAFGRKLGPSLRVVRMLAWNRMQAVLHGRPTRLANGNALVARLWLALRRFDVPLWLGAPALRLTGDGARVDGAIVSRGGWLHRIRASKGVILASGGLSHDIEARQRLYGHPAGAEAHFSLTAPGNRGDGARMAAAFGGHVSGDVSDGGGWMPVSKVPRRDGGWGLFLHSLNQGKPGFIAVTREGRRFVDESLSYHDFVRAMVAADPSPDQKGCWLICDDRAFKKYGIGFVKPILPAGWLESKGYVHRAGGIAALARSIGADPVVLERTIREYNGAAGQGLDPVFGKGSHAYGCYLGDPMHRPSPNVAPLDKAPWRAVFVHPGDIGMFAGLAVSPRAEVLDGEGRPVPGLCAVGNDMLSVFRGSYPGGGSLIGPAMTFGYLAGKEMAG